MKDYKELLVPENATWREAIECYKNIFKVDLSQYFDVSQYVDDFSIKPGDPLILTELDGDDVEYSYIQAKKTKSSLLAQIEETYHLGIPDELVDLYTNHGAFSINDIYGIKVMEPELNIFPPMVSIVSGITMSL